MGEAEGQKRSLVDRAKQSFDNVLDKLSINGHSRRLVYHYIKLTWQQLAAMLPITLLQASAHTCLHRQTGPARCMQLPVLPDSQCSRSCCTLAAPLGDASIKRVCTGPGRKCC